MIPHARAELETLAASCSLDDLESTNGWAVQAWSLSEGQVELLVAAYQAVLKTDVDPDIEKLLDELGVDPLGSSPTTAQPKKVMRADAAELLGAATMLVRDGATMDSLHMPNVPKMSRDKSDSGIDIVHLTLDPNVEGDLETHEVLVLASVKHSVKKNASGLRRDLERSVVEEFTPVYLFQQLRVLHGRLVQQGVPPESADRIWPFLRDTLAHDHVSIVCVAVAGAGEESNLGDQAAFLKRSAIRDPNFRVISLPGIKDLHEKLVPDGGS